MKVLVIQKKRIGDVLTSTVIFEALKVKYPDSELHYLIYENALPVVENNPYIDEIIILNKKIRKSKFEFFRFLLSIRKTKYAVVIDAYGKPNSVLIGWFSGAKSTITFDKIYSKILYSHALIRNNASFSNATKAIEHRMLLLQPFGIEFKELHPKIFLADIEIANAKIQLELQGINIKKPIVMISALGSSVGKTYPLDYLAKVLNWIAERELQIILNYLPNQKEDITNLIKLCNLKTRSQIFIDFYEPDLRKFLAVTSLCKALIGNEGGATNMSKALEIPTFSIYSPNVKKHDWSYYENQTNIVAVHIDDYIKKEESLIFAKLYEVQDVFQIYSKFTPDLFKLKLNDFLTYNIK